MDGLAAQTRPPDRVVAVDTGSKDASADLLRERFGEASVQAAPRQTPFGDAVAKALAALPSLSDQDWIWLLHDDSAPSPDALELLLTAAAEYPSVDILGPKLREWPSLRRLLEVGVTISGTGRRETGLERGEYDQGQHDQIRDVLAVNTAGMLVRREVLEKLGFDKHLPMFGNDVDLGWRAARSGHRTLVVPDAVVFHVEAAHRGVRRTELTGKHFHRREREAALYTLLVSCRPLALPFQAVRLLLGSMIRALGFLLVRAPGEAADEMAAVARVYTRPVRILGGRRRRKRAATVSHRDMRHLLAPPWLPYRHGLDFVTDVAMAVASQATDYSAARRARVEAAETGPVPEEAQNLPEDTGLLARTLTNPVAGVFALLVALAVWAAAGLVGGGMLSGGALLPAPRGALDWWQTYLASHHDLGIGSDAPAAPYLLPLAVVGTLLVGKAWLVVDLIFLLAVPIAAFGGYRFLRLLTRSRAAALWGGVAYGLLPVLTGAVQEGRLGTVAASLVLPWLAHAAMFLAPSHSADRRWRAAWRTALLLAVTAAFAPLALVLAIVLTGALLLVGRVEDRAQGSDRSTWAPLVTAVGAALVLLLPWTLATWGQQGWSSWVLEAGLPSPAPADGLGWRDVVFGRPGNEGAPWWLGIGVVLAAVAALARADARRQVLRPWLVIVAGLLLTAVLAGLDVEIVTSGLEQPVWLGFPLLVVQAAAITAAAVAATGIRALLSGAAFGWRQPLGAAVVLVALLAPVAGLGWWAVSGSGDPLDRGSASAVPTYITDAATADPLDGVLVVEGDAESGLDYLLLRGPGLRVGDESVLPTADEQTPLTDLVATLAGAPEPEDIDRLASFGVAHVYAPAPVDTRLAGNLDSVSGTAQASAVQPGARAWQVLPERSGESLSTDSSATRPWLLAVQVLAVVTALVLAAPTRKVTR